MLPIITEKSFSGTTWGKAREHSSDQWEYHWTLHSILPGVWEESESCGRPLRLSQKKETATHLADKKVTTYPITTDIFHWILKDGWRGVLWDQVIA